MYGLVKTHKADNPVRVITSGCETALKNLCIFDEKCLFPELSKTESRVQHTSEMLNFIDFLNDSNILTDNCMLVSFHIVIMFPSIGNESGLQAVKKALEARAEQFPPTLYIIEALELCLKYNNSIAYGDIAIEQFDKKAFEYNPPVTGWKTFRDDIFLVWTHSAEDLNLLFNYMNNIDRTKKIQFTNELAKNVLELFLDLKLISVRIQAYLGRHFCQSY